MKKIMCVSAFFTTFVLAAFVCALAGLLPDTGQTKCYNNSEEITCPQPGEDFYGQDASYLINPPSYTKLDAQGNDLPDSATEWVMVRDNVTGLIWEVKTDDGSIHDKDSAYNWHQAQDMFISQVNASSFGGHSDWRLPTIKELASIVNLGTALTIDSVFFPNTKSSHYWADSTYADGSNTAWAVGFLNGNVDYTDKSHNHFYVRCVRGGPSGTFNSLIINGDGTVTDSSTGLMWQQDTAPGIHIWGGALSYSESLTLAGYDDWRLPNQTELQSIVDYGLHDPAIDDDFFSITKLSDYWSSSTNANNSNRARYVDFRSGHVEGSTKGYHNYVRCVRGGQNQLTGHLVISTPAQASSWNVGASMSITWDTQDISGNVKISISRQGGKDGTFETIAESTENDGTYNWTVTGTASVNCVLKIEPIDDTSKGTTQGLFTIDTISYVEPNGECGGNTPCYTSIQEAVDAASDDTTIKVSEGTYEEDITVDQANNLTLQGGWNPTFTSQSSTSTVYSLTIDSNSGTVEIENLVLQ